MKGNDESMKFDIDRCAQIASEISVETGKLIESKLKPMREGSLLFGTMSMVCSGLTANLITGMKFAGINDNKIEASIAEMIRAAHNLSKMNKGLSH